MMHTVTAPVLAALLVGLPARDARAEGGERPSCSRMTVEAAPPVEARWPGLPQRIRDAFDAREDVDRCARILLTSRGETVGVVVVLPDGRTAQRPVPRPEDLIPALEALLIIPPASAARTEPSAPAATTRKESPKAPVTPGPAESPVTVTTFVPVQEAPSSAAAQSSGHLGIELSAWTGARAGDGQAGLGLGALSFLEVSGWLVGFAGQVDRYEVIGAGRGDGARTAGALELAVLGGRRWRLGTMALDLVAGPATALGGTSTYATQTSTGNAVSGSASNTVPRLLVEARLGFAARSTVHPFVGLDGDFGPASSPDASQLPDAPRLPTWTAGVAFGATVGTQR
ncbi:MAG TPA: hypothetical protein VIY73_18245 [Polyangiaceae bacterium]